MNTQPPTITSLSPSDLPKWTHFCAHCFSHKPNPPPPSYFHAHYHNDPRADASLIRGISNSHNELRSALRIFRKTCSIGTIQTTQSVEVGGIGEVCTHPLSRKQGLVRRLLMDAVLMMEKEGMVGSLLHAGEDVRNIYESVGYRSVVSRWSVVNVNWGVLNNMECENVRVVTMTEDVTQLQTLHQQSSEHRFCGCLVRSHEYWTQYLSQELGSSLYVLTHHTRILAWMSVKHKGQYYQIREYGRRTRECGIDAFPRLLYQCLKSCREDGMVELQLPTWLWEELQGGGIKWRDESVNMRREDDHGWMVRDIGNGESFVGRMRDSGKEHWIWPSDSF